MSPSKIEQLHDKHGSAVFYNDRYAHGYMDDWPATKKQRIQEVLLSLNLPSNGTVLDFGCGTGVLTEVIAQALPGWSVYGTDLSTVAITTARQRYPGRQFFAANDPTLEGRQFDLVVTHHVLEHVYDVEEVLGELTRRLSAQGAMLHILPCGNEGSFCYSLSRMRRGGIDPKRGNRFFFEDEGHLRRMTTDELLRICTRHGFDLEREYYTGHHYGAIDYFTRIEPQQIPLMTDWSQAIDTASKWRIFRLAVSLRGISACRSFAGRFEKKWRQTSKNSKDWLRLGLVFVPYVGARAIDRRVARKATEEWNSMKSYRNGDQMFVYLTRRGGRR